MQNKLLIKLFIYNFINFSNLIAVSCSFVDYNKKERKNVSWFVKLTEICQKNYIPYSFHFIREKVCDKNIIKYNKYYNIIFFKNENYIVIKDSIFNFLLQYNFNKNSFNVFKNIFLKFLSSYKISNDYQNVN
jgi:hypothetical protein